MKKENWIGFLPFYLLVAIMMIGIAHGGSHAVTTAVQNQPISRNVRFVIDAGHGGEDGGATSCTGILESEINLQIAICLNDLLHLLGKETYMIRTTDTSVYTTGETLAAKKISDLKERVRIVNETENAVLISIHQNTYQDTRYGGAQVFYSSDAESKTLAMQLQSAFVQSINPGSNRKCKKAESVYLMRNIKKPGILVECGFISNPQEESLLRTKIYQQKICCVIAATVSFHTGT